MLLEVGQAILGLDVEAGGADEKNAFLVLDGDELLRGRVRLFVRGEVSAARLVFSATHNRAQTHRGPGNTAGLDPVGHVADGGEQDVEADELRVHLLRVPRGRLRRVDALSSQ